MAAAPKKTATPLAPRPTFLPVQPATGVPNSQGLPMLRSIAPASATLPTPPTTTTAAVLSATATPTVDSTAPVNGGANNGSSSGTPNQVHPKTEDAMVTEKGAPTTPGRRQFTWEDEAVLVDLWKKHISEYFNGVRKRVLEKMTEELNSKLSAPPHFTVKQVNNKLHYMERRYRSLLDDFRNTGTHIAAPDAPVSIRASIERKFSLFYVVHDVLADVVDASQPSVTAQVPPTPTGATTTVDTTTTAPPPVNPGVVTTVSVLPETNHESPQIACEPIPMAMTPPEVPHGMEAPIPPVAPPGKRAVDGSAVVSSPKRARRSVSPEPIAARVAAVMERMMTMSERMIEADREERRERAERNRRASEVRLKEIELMDKNTSLKLTESKNALHRQKVEAAKFLVEQASEYGDAATRSRAFKQLEELANSN